MTEPSHFVCQVRFNSVANMGRRQPEAVPAADVDVDEAARLQRLFVKNARNLSRAASGGDPRDWDWDGGRYNYDSVDARMADTIGRLVRRYYYLVAKRGVKFNRIYFNFSDLT